MFAAYFMLPPTPTSTLLFAAAMGMLWWPGLAPLIGGLVAENFGTRYMATLLGLSFVVHQLGSSLGAFGGGLIYDLFGSYDHAWQIGTLIGFAGVIQILVPGQQRGRGLAFQSERRLAIFCDAIDCSGFLCGVGAIAAVNY